MAKKKQAGKEATEAAERTRVRYRTLLVGNPNYFGNEPASGFKLVEAIASNTAYEELTSVGYNPRIKRLFATLDIKRSTGYQGDLCDDGSTEYVRFHADFGSGWHDVGVVATDVHDIPEDTDCANREQHPLSYSLELPYSPPRKWCTSPQLPVVRAILSWNVEPPAGNANWKPVYGNVVDCAVQIDKSFSLTDFIDELAVKAKVPGGLIDSVKPLLPVLQPELPEIPDLPEPPLPGFDPLAGSDVGALSLESLVKTYSAGGDIAAPRLTVEPSRFAFAAMQAIAAGPTNNIGLIQSAQAALDQVGVDITDLVAKIEDTTGNISYEELVDVGLDPNREKVDATYMIKKSSGFSGAFCTSGSVEYVAFWADWNDTCEWSYLDTVKVKAYDFERLPDGGLCYTASLPVDLTDFKQRCNDPKVARVRAVLSWDSAPSTTDPDEVPTWGNRLDSHVLLPRLEGAPGTLAVIGGINTESISDITGMAFPTAKFVDNGALVTTHSDLECPFGGLITVRGPAIVGERYRLKVVDSTGSHLTLTEKVWISPSNGGIGQYHSADADGWFDYRAHSLNFEGILGYYRSAGDDVVTIELEIEGDGVVDSQLVQLDNTWPEVSISITAPGGDCDLVKQGELLEGVVTATDVHMHSWRVEIDGGPAGFGPVPTTTGSAGIKNVPGTPPDPDGVWTFETETLEQCGYVARVVGSDRAIVNSHNQQHHRSVDVGFCIIE